MDKRAHVISDVFDPTKGSEFQVANVALFTLLRCHSGPILLWTTERDSNKNNISRWLTQNNLNHRIEVKLIEMKHANKDGHHASRYLFLLDLINLYKNAAREIKSGELVWKCGQLNILFNLFSILWLRCDLLGPLAGLEKPRFKKIAGLSLSFRFRYFIYYLLINFARLLLILGFFAGRFRFVIAATSHDKNALSVIPQNRLVQHPEVSLDDLLDQVKPRLNKLIKGSGAQLLWMGGLIERKNPLLAVEVLAQTLIEHPDATAIMIGVGPLKVLVQEAISNQSSKIGDRLILLDPVSRSDFIALLNRVDVLLVTSIREVNSVLILEALAADIAVVSLAISGMRDTVSKSGYLVTINDGDLINRLVENLNVAIKCGPKGSPRKNLIFNHKFQRDQLDTVVHRILHESN